MKKIPLSFLRKMSEKIEAFLLDVVPTLSYEDIESLINDLSLELEKPHRMEEYREYTKKIDDQIAFREEQKNAEYEQTLSDLSADIRREILAKIESNDDLRMHIGALCSMGNKHGWFASDIREEVANMVKEKLIQHCEGDEEDEGWYTLC